MEKKILYLVLGKYDEKNIRRKRKIREKIKENKKYIYNQYIISICSLKLVSLILNIWYKK